MYQFIEERKLFDKWGYWCERENEIHRVLGVNPDGYPRRSTIDVLMDYAEPENAPVRYGEEPPPRPDDSDMQLISALMRQWHRQLPQVHQALTLRHRHVLAHKALAYSGVRLTDRDRAFLLLGDGSWDGAALFLSLCEGGYRLLRVSLNVDGVRQIAMAA